MTKLIYIGTALLATVSAFPVSPPVQAACTCPGPVQPPTGPVRPPTQSNVPGPVKPPTQPVQPPAPSVKPPTPSVKPPTPSVKPPTPPVNPGPVNPGPVRPPTQPSTVPVNPPGPKPPVTGPVQPAPGPSQPGTGPVKPPTTNPPTTNPGTNPPNGGTNPPTTPVTPPAQTFFQLDQSARFENTAGLPLVAASPIGVYLDLFWQGMSLAQTSALTNLVGVVPNSPPNVAAFSALDLATVSQGQPSMKTTYQDSTVDHFDLKSFYYGCTVAAQVSVVGVPNSCTITIKGYTSDTSTTPVATQDFGFTVGKGSVLGLQTSSQMVKATVGPKFKGLKKVDFFVTNNALTAGLIDSVDYTVYSTRRWT